MNAEPPYEPPAIVVAPAEAPAPLPPSASEEADTSDPPELDFGLGAFFLVGGGAGGYVGLSPFLTAEVSPGWLLRPSVALGQSMATNVRSTFVAARLDGCWQMPGRYARHSGMELDVCAGPDVGFSYVSPGTDAGSPAAGQTLPYVALGPSIELRADAPGFAFALRATGGIDVVHAGFTDATGAEVEDPVFTWRLELAVSWDLHGSRRPDPSTRRP